MSEANTKGEPWGNRKGSPNGLREPKPKWRRSWKLKAKPKTESVAQKGLREPKANLKRWGNRTEKTFPVKAKPERKPKWAKRNSLRRERQAKRSQHEVCQVKHSKQQLGRAPIHCKTRPSQYVANELSWVHKAQAYTGSQRWMFTFCHTCMRYPKVKDTWEYRNISQSLTNSQAYTRHNTSKSASAECFTFCQQQV